MKKPMRITESVSYGLPKQNVTRALESAVDNDRPAVLFTEIKAITANWVTRNKTFYSSESLIGDPNEGTGAISFIYPYPVPLIRDHISGPNEFMPASLPYGRIYNCQFVNEPRTGGGYLKTIAAITDPFAIEAILTGRFYTVSIGTEVTKVVCSICGTDLVAEGLCEHYKGQIYNGVECYWKMGPIRARELSFVNVPSDSNAQIMRTSIDAGEARVLLANVGADYLFDLASGTRVSTEHYRQSTLGISRGMFSTIVESAEAYRDIYKTAGARKPNYVSLLTNDDYRETLRKNVKGI